MIGYSQETDSKIVHASPTEIHYSIPGQLANETSGGYTHFNFLPLHLGPNLLRRAWQLIHKLDDRDIANQARRLLSAIQEGVSIFQELHLDLSHLPQLQPFIADDGSVLFEWIFHDYRVGFSIEPDPDESGWFLITDHNLGEITASGMISGTDLQTLTLWLLSFIVSHS